MSLRAGSVTLRMRPPGATAWTTVATSLATGRAVAVDDVKIRWSQPTPRDHPDPGGIDFTLLVDEDTGLDAALLAYDTEFVIEAALEVWANGRWENLAPPPNQPVTHPLARGWVTSWSRGHLRPDRRRPYRVTGIDIFGRAAATRLAAQPWPAHTPAQRVAAINAASVAGPLLAATAAVTQEPYDVDNAPALDVIRRHMRLSLLTVETLAGIDTAPRITRQLTTSADALRLVSVAGSVLDIPASIVEDSGRDMNRTSVVSEVGVQAYWGQETDRRTVTYKNPTGSYSSSRYSLDTDARLHQPDPSGTYIPSNISAWATSLIRESATAATLLPSARILLDRPGAGRRVADLVILGRRQPAVIRITAGGPSDLDKIHYVTGGELVIHGRTLRLTVKTEPGRTSGFRSLRFADWPHASGRPRLKVATIEPFGYRIRIADMHATLAPWPGTI